MKMGLSSVDRWRSVACMFDLEGLLSVWFLERGGREEEEEVVVVKMEIAALNCLFERMYIPPSLLYLRFGARQSRGDSARCGGLAFLSSLVLSEVCGMVDIPRCCFCSLSLCHGSWLFALFNAEAEQVDH